MYLQSNGYKVHQQVGNMYRSGHNLRNWITSNGSRVSPCNFWHRHQIPIKLSPIISRIKRKKEKFQSPNLTEIKKKQQAEQSE